MGLGLLTNRGLQVFKPHQLANSYALGRTLASGALGNKTATAIALLETALEVTQEDATDLKALLEGCRETTNYRERGEFLIQAAQWLSSHGSKVKKTLDYLRNHFVLQSMRFAEPEVVAATLMKELRKNRTAAVLMAGGTNYSPAGVFKPKAKRDRLEAAPVAALAIGGGIRLSQELRQTLQLSQSLQLQHKLFSPSQSFYQRIFDRAKKLHIQIPALGLDFEVALINRFDLVEMTHLGSAGVMISGFCFVVEDFLVDIHPKDREAFLKLVAVHEYGEAIFGDHHLASLLELAVAKYWGIQEDYLKFLEERYKLKFRDVALHRLKKPLLKDLRKKGFDTSEIEKEEWRPADPGEAEVRNAQDIIRRYPVPEALRKRFEAAIKNDKQISDEELEEWADYITVLEQARGFNQRALLDVQEGLRQLNLDPHATPFDYHLTLRLALFRSLGVLRHEISEKVLEWDKLEKEVKDRLANDLLENLREIIQEEAEGLADDPLLEATRAELEELAQLDSELWSLFDKQLFLIPPEQWRKNKGVREGEKTVAEIKKEQAKIEQTRKQAWEAALSRADLKDQISVLGDYRSGLAYFKNHVAGRLEGIIQSIRARGYKKDFPEFLDQEDKRVVQRALLWDDLRDGISELNKIAGFVQAEIDESLPDFHFNFRRPLAEKTVFLARLKYLVGRYGEADAKGKEKIKRILEAWMFRLSDPKDDIFGAYSAGILPEDLTIDLLSPLLPDWTVDRTLLALPGQLNFGLLSTCTRFLTEMREFGEGPTEKRKMDILQQWGGHLPDPKLVPYDDVKKGMVQFQKWVRSLDAEKSAYDRYGTLGTRGKNLYAKWMKSRKPGALKEEAKEIIDAHFKAVVAHYKSLEDLRPEEVGQELLQAIHDCLQSKKFLMEPARALAKLYILRAMQTGKKFVNEKDVISYLRSELKLSQYEDTYSLTASLVDEQIREAFTFDALGDRTYDVLGYLSYDERVEASKNPLALYEYGEQGWHRLSRHWNHVLVALGLHPDIEGAKRVLLKVFSDIKELGSEWPRLYDAVRTWIVLLIREGRKFQSVDEAFGELPREMKRTMGNNSSFLAQKVLPARTGYWGEDERLIEILRQHFASQKKQ